VTECQPADRNASSVNTPQLGIRSERQGRGSRARLGLRVCPLIAGQSSAPGSASPGATIVGAVAASQEKNGKDVGELVGLDTQVGARVYTDPDEALALQPDLVVMSIASYMEDMYEPMQRCIRAGTKCDLPCRGAVVQLEHVPRGNR